MNAIYEEARRHGYGHERALECVARGRVQCWCGCPMPCIGGAQRFVGCVKSFTPDYPGCRPAAAALTAATALKRSHQEVDPIVPAAPEVLPEETR